MLQPIPEGWRQTVTRLRDDIHAALDRWLHRRPTWLVQHNGHQRADHHTMILEALMSFQSPVLVAPGSPTSRLQETDDDLIVIADLPGLDRHDFTVELIGERLIIRGAQQYTVAQQGHGDVSAEHCSGAFARVLRLPCEIDPEHAQATYTAGGLRVILPKTARRPTAGGFSYKINLSPGTAKT